MPSATARSLGATCLASCIGRVGYLLGSVVLLLITWPVPAQAQPQFTTPQLWQALRQHPQLDRRHVDLLNEIAGEHLRMIDGVGGGVLLRAPQFYSSTRRAYALAHRLHYPAGEAYATLLNPILNPLVLDSATVYAQIAAGRFNARQMMKEKLIPLMARSGDNRLVSQAHLDLILADESDKDNPRYLQRAIASALASRAPHIICHAYRAKGYFYRKKGDYYQGLQGFFQQLHAAQQAGLPDEAADALCCLGDMYTNMGDYTQGLAYYQQAAAYAKTVTPAIYRAVVQQITFLGAGNGHLRAGHYPQALAALQQSVSAFQQAKQLGAVENSEVLHAKCLVAEIYERQRSPETLPYTRQLLREAHQRYAVDNYAELLLTLGRHYLHTGQADSAIANGLRALRVGYNSSSFKYLSYKEGEIYVLQLLFQAYALRRQYSQAYAYQSRYVGLRDTLNNEQVARRATALLYDQSLARQRSKIVQLTQSQQQQAQAARRQRFWLLATLAGLAGLATGAALLWRLNRQKQQANAQLATQKTQLEAQATRLGELDVAKNQFFANASHELRTPLTLVLGPLESLLTVPAAALPAPARAAVALAHGQARRLHQLVNRILDLTKLQAGRLALQPRPTSLSALLRRVVAQFESLAVQRGITLTSPAALPPEAQRVLLDADKVEEVLTNLLINALNHTPAGGAVLVSAALPGPDGQHTMTVRDTGPGIAAAEQERVFERFYQSPQRQAQGGTGLGLALSRELAELLGGTLMLESEPGQGAAFTLRFPAPPLPDAPLADEAIEPADLPPALVAPAAAGPRSRVLVVEDQPDLRAYLQSLLAPAHEVLTAADGQAALELLAREGPVDLITTDAMMPRLSGIELLTQLRADPVLYQVPVLMLTARADEAHRLHALTVGVDDYLTKPFATAELLARTQALLARQQVRRQFAALPPEAEFDQAPPRGADSPQSTAGPDAPSAAQLVVAAPPVEQLVQWQARVSPHLPDETFGPVELAGLLCVSERTLYRRLGELAGLTPAAWLRELRLDQARRLLEAGGFGSVAAVAEAVGFTTVKLFNQRYTERFGRRPTDYGAEPSGN